MPPKLFICCVLVKKMTAKQSKAEDKGQIFPENMHFFHVHVCEAAIPFTCKAPEKKSRPLSATRRTESMDKVDDNAQEIFKAMAEENQTIGGSYKIFSHLVNSSQSVNGEWSLCFGLGGRHLVLRVVLFTQMYKWVIPCRYWGSMDYPDPGAHTFFIVDKGRSNACFRF